MKDANKKGNYMNNEDKNKAVEYQYYDAHEQTKRKLYVNNQNGSRDTVEGCVNKVDSYETAEVSSTE